MVKPRPAVNDLPKRRHPSRRHLVRAKGLPARSGMPGMPPLRKCAPARCGGKLKPMIQTKKKPAQIELFAGAGNPGEGLRGQIHQLGLLGWEDALWTK